MIVPEVEFSKTIIICGPTGSGKSDLAKILAQELNGTIINADSMQVYEGLRILTDRPTQSDEIIVPHKLYGFVDPADSFSVALWKVHAIREIKKVLSNGRVPILVGGTGLYITALLKGLAPVPEIPHKIRNDVRQLFENIGREEFCRRLNSLDPIGFSEIQQKDTHRLLRLYEVVEYSGRTLKEWQGDQGSLSHDTLFDNAHKFVLAPDREVLYDKINRRVEMMVDSGVVEEVELFLARNLQNDVAVMKALGLREFKDYISEKYDLEHTVSRIQLATRRYSKRQMTWFRHQIPSAKRLEGFGSVLSKLVETIICDANQVDPIQSKD
tara:strand:+ start:23506 stop:24483 length:978 start_codon:yes stop_codon:yes gene_type:complete